MTRRLSNESSKLVRLLHQAKYRQRNRLFLAEGRRLLRDLAAGPLQAEFVFAEAESLVWALDVFDSRMVFEAAGRSSSLFATQNAQGVGAVVAMPAPRPLSDLAGGDTPLLYLDRISDPGNAGTILRTADWFGLGDVLLGRQSVDPYNPKTVRATMGAIFRLTIHTDCTAEDLAALRRPVYALDASARVALGQCPLPQNGIYVIGSEAEGVALELLQHATSIAIPGAGTGESLNAAIAAGILCYELSRSEQK